MIEKRCSHLLHVIITNDDSTFSAVALNLVGVSAQGMTLDEVIDNIRIVATVMIDTYRADGEAIPWTEYRFVTPPPGTQKISLMLDT